TNNVHFHRSYEPEVIRATCFVAFASCPPGTGYGSIAKVDLLLGTTKNAALQDYLDLHRRQHFISSVTFVTGSHAFKTGMQGSTGFNHHFRQTNGDLVQRYRTGVPDSVQIGNTPIDGSGADMKEVGLYVQDSWTIKRLTLNPGIRFDYLNGKIKEYSSPA